MGSERSPETWSLKKCRSRCPVDGISETAGSQRIRKDNSQGCSRLAQGLSANLQVKCDIWQENITWVASRMAVRATIGEDRVIVRNAQEAPEVASDSR